MRGRGQAGMLTIVVVLALAASGCGGDDDEGAQQATKAESEQPSVTEPTPGGGTGGATEAEAPAVEAPAASVPAAAPAAPVPTPSASAAPKSAAAAKPVAAAKPGAGAATGAAPAGDAAAPKPGAAAAAAPAPGAPAPNAPAPAAPGGKNTASDVGVTETAIKVGHIGILTGPVSSVGDDISWAGQAVLAATNDAGGINGRKLNVLVRDDAWDGTKGMNAARDLVNREKIYAFCCTQTVATTDLLAVYTDEVKVPNVGSDGFGDDQYDRQWSWPAGNSSINDGYALAEYAVKEQGAKTIGLLYFDGTFGRDYRDGYKLYAEKLGAKVVVEQAGSFDDPGTATFIARSRAANVDLLTFNGEPGLWVKMVREAASQGYKPKLGFQGATGIYFNEIPGLAGPHAEGTVTTTHWTPNDVGEARGNSDPGYARYSALVTKYYPKIQHGNWTKVGYSGALHWVDIVKRLGANVTRQGMKDVADAYTEWDVGLGTKVNFWCSNRGNHTVNVLKLVKDPDAANSPDPRTRDAVRSGNGMRYKFLAGPFQDTVNHPDGTSDNPATNKPCSKKGPAVSGGF